MACSPETILDCSRQREHVLSDYGCCGRGDPLAALHVRTRTSVARVDLSNGSA